MSIAIKLLHFHRGIHTMRILERIALLGIFPMSKVKSRSAKESQKYNITKRDEDRAARIREIYNRKKAELGLSQASIGQRLGMGQSAVGKYMNCRIPMNLPMVMKFAELLEVPLHELEPDLDQRFKVLPNQFSETKLPVLGTQSGMFTKIREIAVKGTGYMKHQLVILVDTDALAPIIAEGSSFVVDPLAVPHKKSEILVQMRLNNTQIPYYLTDQDDDGIWVTAIMQKPGVELSDLAHPEWFPVEKTYIPYTEISNVRSLTDIQIKFN